MKKQNALLLFLLVIALACTSPQGPTLILHNANVITMDEAQPKAQAIAIAGNKIMAVGSDSEILKRAGAKTEILDVQGKTIIPGIIEGHAHFLGIGNQKMVLDLQAVRSWDEIVGLVQKAALSAKPGEWILGRGWHQEKWNTKPTSLAEGYPLHFDLSSVSPNNPVMLTHASGHADIVNQRAMEVAGITESTKDPENGQIIRTSRGLPAGVFLGSARSPLWSAYQGYEATLDPNVIHEKERQKAILAAQEMLENGITSLHDAGSAFSDIPLYKELISEGKLPVRLYLMMRVPYDTLAKYGKRERVVGYGNHHLTVRAVKLSLDGALGARSAWMLKPYSDLNIKTGINYVPIPAFERIAQLAHELDYQMSTHAIGDRANRETLNIYETIFTQTQAPAELRWRVEHAQHLHPEDIPRFAQLGVIASIQAIHCVSDGPWVPLRIGEQRAAEGAYRWKDFVESGVVVANGTDAPVEDIDPIANFHATVTRLMKNGKRFYPEQALTRQQALRSMTLDAAYAAFEEDLKGSLEAGKLADLVVLNQDLLTVEEEAILQTQVLKTIVGGKVLYQAEAN